VKGHHARNLSALSSVAFQQIFSLALFRFGFAWDTGASAALANRYFRLNASFEAGKPSLGSARRREHQVLPFFVLDFFGGVGKLSFCLSESVGAVAEWLKAMVC
jgi:hypothetical protein